ncbi:MAG: biotin--[acetyl-CoA-carboxylase] ligase [Acidobacteria bacterium]|nr:biotin--[acetyl-CoA-carboxylase] ligase [Acidobacteriota bacterium]
MRDALKYPPLLTDLGHVGRNGLPLNSDPGFQHEIEQCREWGFRLEISGDKVRLVYDQEQLVPYWIQKETPAVAWDWLRVNGFFRLPSTNSEALDQARRGAPGGTLVYAEEQTEGRGRNRHSWFSSAGTGLCFTVVLRPMQPIKTWPLLTHVASVALVETLKEFETRRPLSVDLKWPNDVLLSGKKCAGILLEMISEGDNRAAVVGVGINVHEGSVPDSLKSSAVCLDEAAGAIVPRRRLLVRFLHNLQLLYQMFERGDHAAVLDRWKGHSSMWNGTEVRIIEGESSRDAVTCGLNSVGALLVRTEGGRLETIVAGDVQLKR